MRGAEADTIFQNDFDLLPKLTVTDPDARRRAKPNRTRDAARGIPIRFYQNSQVRRFYQTFPNIVKFSFVPVATNAGI